MPGRELSSYATTETPSAFAKNERAHSSSGRSDSRGTDHEPSPATHSRITPRPKPTSSAAMSRVLVRPSKRSLRPRSRRPSRGLLAAGV